MGDEIDGLIEELWEHRNRLYEEKIVVFVSRELWMDLARLRDSHGQPYVQIPNDVLSKGPLLLGYRVIISEQPGWHLKFGET